MISFQSDYNNGTHPDILRRFIETNAEKHPGYGDDEHCHSAREKIRAALKLPHSDVFFLVGGTQTNATVISSLLQGCEGVVAVTSGHIAVHEAGAVEGTGHKVLTLPHTMGKMEAETLRNYLTAFHADPTAAHCVQPGMVYITFPTELGTVYSADELWEIHAVCREFSLPLFIDGARLGYGLAAEGNTLTLPQLARLCEVFYIGGTKMGALLGEAVVFSGMKAPRHFFTTVKRQGALLAKGHVLGLQFETLFSNNLYLNIGRHAVALALRMKEAFRTAGLTLPYDSPTNQQFVVLSREQHDALTRQFAFDLWEVLPSGQTVYRFVTSWATTEAEVEALEKALNELCKG